MSEVYEAIKEIIIDILEVDEGDISPESNFRDDLKADSLDLVELIMEFEDKFGGHISDEDAQNIVTVADAVSYIEGRMAEAGK